MLKKAAVSAPTATTIAPIPVLIKAILRNFNPLVSKFVAPAAATCVVANAAVSTACFFVSKETTA